MQYYPIIYHPGFSGTWTSWFVNNHKTFPNYSLEYCVDGASSSLELANDCGCRGSKWNMEVETLKESDSRVHDLASNKTATKRSLRIIPYHEIPDELSHVIPDMILPQTINYTPIILTLSETAHIEIMAERIHKLFYQDRTFDNIFLQTVDVCANKYYNAISYATDYLYLDIGKLIFDLDISEYNKLLHFIDDEPVANWQELIIEMRTIIFKNFIKSSVED